VHEEKEAPLCAQQFYLMREEESAGGRLRCLYCESEMDQFVVANRKSKWYSTRTGDLAYVDATKSKRLHLFCAGRRRPPVMAFTPDATAVRSTPAWQWDGLSLC